MPPAGKELKKKKEKRHMPCTLSIQVFFNNLTTYFSLFNIHVKSIDLSSAESRYIPFLKTV